MWPAEVDVGEGLTLRAPDPIDAEGATAAVNRSLEHLRPFMAWATAPTTVDQQAVRLAVSAEAWRAGGDVVYTIFDGDEVLGGVGLHDRQGPHAVEIGYWLVADRQGKGIITRCVAALVDVVFAREGMERVVIRCDVANRRSAAVPARLGFTLVEVEDVDPVAPAQTGRREVWELRRGGDGGT